MFLPNICVIVNFVNADLSNGTCLPQLITKGFFVNSKSGPQGADEYSGIPLKIGCHAL